MRRLALLAVVIPVLAGCGASGSGGSEPSTPEATVSSSEPPEPEATTEHATASTEQKAASGPEVTGFGATAAAWNANHTEDTNFNHEAAYNPNSSLPEVDGRPGDEYGDVTQTNGRVTGYEYHFQSESVKQAQSAILRGQFPADATIFHYEPLDTCAIMLVKSPTLTRALGLPSGTPPAQISLEDVSSETGESAPFDPASVNLAIVSKGFPGIEKITGGKC